MKATLKNSFVLAALLGFVSALQVHAVATLSVGSVQTNAASIASIPITLSGASGVVAAQFDLVYPTTNLTSSSAVGGGALAGHAVVSTEASLGKRRVVIYSITNAVLSDDILAHVPLSVSPNTPGSVIPLTLTNVILASASGARVSPVTILGGNLTIPTNDPPTLDPISNQVVDANRALIVTNFARDAVLPGQKLNFSLLTAPTGARIRNLSATNAVFFWTPACEQGGTTNVITIQVSDNGTPPLSATRTFTVIVPDCVQVSLGSTVVRAGDSVAVPMDLLSTVRLSNVTLLIEYPSERLTNFTLLINTQQVAAAPLFNLSGKGLLDVGLNLQTNHVLRISTNTAMLGVTAYSNQSSAFVWIQLPVVEALRPDGSMVTNAYGLPGRVVVVGEEPLLEALRAPTNQVMLLQYAIPGSTIRVQWTTNVFTGVWQSSTQNTQTNLVQETGSVVPNLPMLFFQAIRGTNGL